MTEKIELDMDEGLSTSGEMPNSTDKKTTRPMEGDEEMDRPMEGEMERSTEKAGQQPMKRGTEEPMATP